MDKQQADLLIAEFGKQVGLPSLALAGNGSCGATFTGNVTVSIAFDLDAGAVSLESRLVGVDLNPDCMKGAIAANFCWVETAGAIFGVDRLRKQLVLRRRVSAVGMDVAGLVDAVQALVVHTRAWTNRLSPAEGEKQTTAAVHRPIDPVLRA